MIQHTRALLTPFCRVGGRVCNRGASSSPQKIIPNHLSFTWSIRCHSNNNQGSGVNGSADDIIDSAAATTQWKRNHYQKIEDKFNNKTSSTTDTQNLEPLNIDDYEDVQPMWKAMESRVTQRRSLTLEQLKRRGGVSGRRNIRKSEEDYWVKAGVYDDKEEKKD